MHPHSLSSAAFEDSVRALTCLHRQGVNRAAPRGTDQDLDIDASLLTAKQSNQASATGARMAGVRPLRCSLPGHEVQIDQHAIRSVEVVLEYVCLGNVAPRAALQ